MDKYYENVMNLNTAALVDAAGNIIKPPPKGATAARDQRLIQLSVRVNFDSEAA